MRLIRGLLVLSLIVMLAAPISAAPAAKKAKTSAKATAKKTHQHQHIVHGTVVAVHHEQGGNGTIKVKLAGHHHQHKAISARAAAKPHHHHGVVTFQVNKHTKFEFTMHQSGKEHHQPASFSAVKKGEHVRIHVSAKHHHLAKKVEILKGQQTKTTVAKKPTTKKPTTKNK
jgi:hypothetical protein